MIEGLTRCLANEWGPKLRVVCVRSEAMPETRAIKQTFAAYARTIGMTTEDFERFIIEKNPLKRSPSAKDTANVAVFTASDMAATITGATLNSTSGAVLDQVLGVHPFHRHRRMVVRTLPPGREAPIY